MCRYKEYESNRNSLRRKKNELNSKIDECNDKLMMIKIYITELENKLSNLMGVLDKSV